MDTLKFKEADVAGKYESDFVNDPIVHVPGGSGEGWKSNLSNIPLAFADKLIEQGSNLVRLKRKSNPSEKSV